LDEATKKTPTSFRGERTREKPKKQVEVNLEDLRKTLKEALGDEK
jgi:hypothetical protein